MNRIEFEKEPVEDRDYMEIINHLEEPMDYYHQLLSNVTKYHNM